MMIGPLIMGTLSTEAFAGYTDTPEPIYVNGKWWSFTQTLRDTPPIVGIKSQFSNDGGATWSEDDITWHTSFTIGTEYLENGIIAGVSGSFVNHKDLDTPASSWIFTNVSTIAGGFIGGGTNLLHTDETNNLFILNKEFGRDLYTSTDCVTYTPINGVTENDLRLNNRLQRAYWIVYTGGQYVAYGIKTIGPPDVYGTASSSDLITWTQETPDVPIFYDIRYFGGAFLGVTLDGASVKTQTVQVWRSTDFINWTQITLPNATQGSSMEAVFVRASLYTLVSNSQVFTSADGLTFSDAALEINAWDTNISITGLQIKLTTATPPSFVAARTVSVDEFGGKILKWANGIDALPNLVYPATNPADETVGFVGTAAGDVVSNGTGIINNGFGLKGNSGTGFYMNNLGVRYFEATILPFTSGSSKIGLYAPAADHFSGLNITRVQLTNASVVETSSGDLPVSYTMADGQVIGFIVNFITGEIEIKVDNVSLATIPNLATSVLWTQLIDGGSNANTGLNVGQDPFVYTQAGTVAWADGYI